MGVKIFLILIFISGCSKQNRLANFIKQNILPPEMQAYELKGYKAIKLKNKCDGKSIYVIPSENFELPIEAGLGINLCGSGGCVYYVVSDDGDRMKVIHEGNYHGFISEDEQGQCSTLLFEGHQNQTVKFQVTTGTTQ